jgi:DNA primase
VTGLSEDGQVKDVVSPHGDRGDHRAAVLQATDIVELIGQSVALKRRGKDFIGLCPFHQEKTPSFHVSPSKQFFHCYGCKAGGNAIDFVMKRDRVEFLEALKVLGQRAGIEMPRYGVSKQKAGERQGLFEANSAACAFFEKLLAQPEGGKSAREYLQKRGFSIETTKAFRVGLAPDAWDALLQSPVAKKFPPPQLLAAGLVKQRENGSGFYDTFRNRLMFPIRDEAGRIIAFGGRVMPGSQDPAKYLNSPETPLFSKSRCIFGLDMARQRIVETRTVVIVEGYTDAVMAHQFGVTNVVSVLGTALTEQHVAILRRFADRIVLLFDADSAGDSAADRSVELFLTQPIEIQIASMPAGTDPDEYLLANGAAGFEALLSNATDALAYKWKQLSRRYLVGSGDLTSQQKAVEEYLETIAGARGVGPVDSLRWGAALARVSRLTEIPVEELHRRFQARPKGVRRAIPMPSRAEDGATEAAAAPTPRGAPTALDLAERWILGALLAEPKRWHAVQQHVRVEDFSEERRRKLAEIYWEQQRHEGEPAFSEFLGLLEDPGLTELAVELVDDVEQLPDVEQTLAGALDRLQWMRQERTRQQAAARLKELTGQQQSSEEADAVLRKLYEGAQAASARNKNL